MPKNELTTLICELDRAIKRTVRLNYRLSAHLLRIARLDLTMRQHGVSTDEVNQLADSIREAQNQKRLADASERL